jgi:tetratricopeptide (TPR) repeat protein
VERWYEVYRSALVGERCILRPMKIWPKLCGAIQGVPSALLLVVLAATLVGCPSTDDQIAEARRAVPEALARGDRDAARKAVASLGTEVPDDPAKLIELAQVLVLAGEAPRALWVLEAGAERFPERADVQLALAAAALRLSNPALARTAAARVPEDAPEHAEALTQRARAELGLGRLDEALALLKDLERRYPERPESRLVRIATLTTEHRNEEATLAVEAAIAAVEGDPDQAELERTFRRVQAQIQLQQREFEPALATLRQMVAADPTDGASWQLLAQGLAANDQAEEAVALMKANLEGDAPSEDLYSLLAPLYAATGRREEAEQALRAYAARSDSPAAVQPLIRHLADQGEAAAVEEAIREAIARFPDEAQLYVMLVEATLELGDLDAAESAAEAYDDLPNALDASREYLRARLELARGDAPAAAERLRKLAPKLDLASTQFWLGRALETQGDLAGAQRRYALAQKRDSAWPAPVSALIGLAARRGDWRAVVGLAQQLLARQPENEDAWLLFSRGLIELEEGEAAEQMTTKAKEALPDEPMLRVHHAHALRLLGRHAEALAEIEEARDAFADEPAVMAEAAIVLGMLGRVQEGMALADRGLAGHPDGAGLHAARASLLYAQGEAAEGDRATDRALELGPEEPHPLVVRCRFRAATGRHAGAIADCTRYEELRPADPRGPFLLGAAYSGAGDREAAIAAYRRAAELDEADHRPRNNLAWLLAQEGDLDGALEVGQEAYRLADDDPYVADTLADLYLRKGLVERAIALLEPAHAAAPQMPDASLHLAQAYVRAGRAEEARPLLEALDAELPADHPLRPALKESLDGLS